MADRVLPDQKGLYSKFVVYENDARGLGGLGMEVTDCFVLRPEQDASALAALMHYAALTPNEELAADLEAWIRSIQRADF